MLPPLSGVSGGVAEETGGRSETLAKEAETRKGGVSLAEEGGRRGAAKLAAFAVGGSWPHTFARGLSMHATRTEATDDLDSARTEQSEESHVEEENKSENSSDGEASVGEASEEQASDLSALSEQGSDHSGDDSGVSSGASQRETTAASPRSSLTTIDAKLPPLSPRAPPLGAKANELHMDPTCNPTGTVEAVLGGDTRGNGEKEASNVRTDATPTSLEVQVGTSLPGPFPGREQSSTVSSRDTTKEDVTHSVLAVHPTDYEPSSPSSLSLAPTNATSEVSLPPPQEEAREAGGAGEAREEKNTAGQDQSVKEEQGVEGTPPAAPAIKPVSKLGAIMRYDSMRQGPVNEEEEAEDSFDMGGAAAEGGAASEDGDLFAGNDTDDDDDEEDDGMSAMFAELGVSAEALAAVDVAGQDQNMYAAPALRIQAAWRGSHGRIAALVKAQTPLRREVKWLSGIVKREASAEKEAPAKKKDGVKSKKKGGKAKSGKAGKAGKAGKEKKEGKSGKKGKGAKSGKKSPEVTQEAIDPDDKAAVAEQAVVLMENKDGCASVAGALASLAMIRRFRVQAGDITASKKERHALEKQGNEQANRQEIRRKSVLDLTRRNTQLGLEEAAKKAEMAVREKAEKKRQKQAEIDRIKEERRVAEEIRQAEEDARLAQEARDAARLREEMEAARIIAEAAAAEAERRRLREMQEAEENERKEREAKEANSREEKRKKDEELRREMEAERQKKSDMEAGEDAARRLQWDQDQAAGAGGGGFDFEKPTMEGHMAAKMGYFLRERSAAQKSEWGKRWWNDHGATPEKRILERRGGRIVVENVDAIRKRFALWGMDVDPAEGFPHPDPSSPAMRLRGGELPKIRESGGINTQRTTNKAIDWRAQLDKGIISAFDAAELERQEHEAEEARENAHWEAEWSVQREPNWEDMEILEKRKEQIALSRRRIMAAKNSLGHNVRALARGPAKPPGYGPPLMPRSVAERLQRLKSKHHALPSLPGGPSAVSLGGLDAPQRGGAAAKTKEPDKVKVARCGKCGRTVELWMAVTCVGDCKRAFHSWCGASLLPDDGEPVQSHLLTGKMFSCDICTATRELKDRLVLSAAEEARMTECWRRIHDDNDTLLKPCLRDTPHEPSWIRILAPEGKAAITQVLLTDPELFPSHRALSDTLLEIAGRWVAALLSVGLRVRGEEAEREAEIARGPLSFEEENLYAAEEKTFDGEANLRAVVEEGSAAVRQLIGAIVVLNCLFLDHFPPTIGPKKTEKKGRVTIADELRGSLKVMEVIQFSDALHGLLDTGKYALKFVAAGSGKGGKGAKIKREDFVAFMLEASIDIGLSAVKHATATTRVTGRRDSVTMSVVPPIKGVAQDVFGNGPARPAQVMVAMPPVMSWHASLERHSRATDDHSLELHATRQADHAVAARGGWVGIVKPALLVGVLRLQGVWRGRVWRIMDSAAKAVLHRANRQGEQLASEKKRQDALKERRVAEMNQRDTAQMQQFVGLTVLIKKKRVRNTRVTERSRTRAAIKAAAMAMWTDVLMASADDLLFLRPPSMLGGDEKNRKRELKEQLFGRFSCLTEDVFANAVLTYVASSGAEHCREAVQRTIEESLVAQMERKTKKREQRLQLLQDIKDEEAGTEAGVESGEGGKSSDQSQLAPSSSSPEGGPVRSMYDVDVGSGQDLTSEAEMDHLFDVLMSAKGRLQTGAPPPALEGDAASLDEAMKEAKAEKAKLHERSITKAELLRAVVEDSSVQVLLQQSHALHLLLSPTSYQDVFYAMDTDESGTVNRQ